MISFHVRYAYGDVLPSLIVDLREYSLLQVEGPTSNAPGSCSGLTELSIVPSSGVSVIVILIVKK